MTKLKFFYKFPVFYKKKKLIFNLKMKILNSIYYKPIIYTVYLCKLFQEQ